MQKIRYGCASCDFCFMHRPPWCEFCKKSGHDLGYSEGKRLTPKRARRNRRKVAEQLGQPIRAEDALQDERLSASGYRLIKLKKRTFNQRKYPKHLDRNLAAPMVMKLRKEAGGGTSALERWREDG